MSSPSSTTPPAAAELPAELLQRAWRLLRPLCWPESYDETMKDELRARQVHMFAAQLQRSDARVAAEEKFPTVVRTAQERRHSPLPALAVGVVDRKRAAAGDRDDD